MKSDKKTSYLNKDERTLTPEKPRPYLSRQTKGEINTYALPFVVKGLWCIIRSVYHVDNGFGRKC